MKTCNWLRAGSLLLIGLAGLVLVGSAQAAFIDPSSVTPGWSRTDYGTTYQAWDVFTAPSGNAPDVANDNPNGTATVSETNGVAFVTGGGNIYAMSGSPAFSVEVPNSPATDTSSVLLQLQTIGSEVIFPSVLINGVGPSQTAELSRISIPAGPPGTFADQVETWYLWTGVIAAGEINITFGGPPHLSLASVSVDTSTVPEPSTALLVMLGLTGLACSGRKKA
ncbi:PEP-CTERM sorting domain-containing protein [Myxococcota bacterium]|nr:PEP-CTERM sorting domain-containing protein [Myxococcota bacterium]